jgi:hypothetical protein
MTGARGGRRMAGRGRTRTDADGRGLEGGVVDGWTDRGLVLWMALMTLGTAFSETLCYAML